MALRRGRGGLSVSPVRAIIAFAAFSVALQAMVGFGALRVLEPRLVRAELERDSEMVSFAATAVIEPAVTPALLAGEGPAVAAFDRLVRQRVLGPAVVRAKLWRADGTVVYADDPRVIGRRYTLSPEHEEILRAGRGIDAQPVNFDRPEHELDRDYGSVDEVYVAIRGPGGEPLMWESHLFRERLVDRAGSALSRFALGGLASAALVLAFQVGYATVLGGQLVDARRDRVRLLRRAADASTFERQRIAGDLHDGVVQDLTGVALELSARAGRDGGDGQLDHLADLVRGTIRQLRTLMVDIYPANLEAVGLPVALAELLDRCEGRMETDLDVQVAERLHPDTERLLYRAAQEGVRNALNHSGGGRVGVSLLRSGEDVVVEVTDDGVGMAQATGTHHPGDHVGLALLSGIVQAAGGTLHTTSVPGRGTTLRVEVPA